MDEATEDRLASIRGHRAKVDAIDLAYMNAERELHQWFLDVLCTRNGIPMPPRLPDLGGSNGNQDQ